MDFACPHCDKTIRADECLAGQTVGCPLCKYQFKVPSVQLPTAALIEDETAEPEYALREPAEPSGGRHGARPKTHEDYERQELRKKLRRRAREERQHQGSASFLDSIPLTYPAQSNLGIGIGLVLNVLIGVLIRVVGSQETLLVLAIPVAIASLAFWLWGCAAYAKNKGYSDTLGILGLFGLIGLIVLVILPTRSRY